MPILVVHRESSLVNLISYFEIELDGAVLGRIWNGQKKVFVVENGKHRVQIVNGCFKSNTVHFVARKGREHSAFCRNNPDQQANGLNIFVFARQVRDEDFYEKSMLLTVSEKTVGT